MPGRRSLRRLTACVMSVYMERWDSEFLIRLDMISISLFFEIINAGKVKE